MQINKRRTSHACESNIDMQCMHQDYFLPDRAYYGTSSTSTIIYLYEILNKK